MKRFLPVACLCALGACFRSAYAYDLADGRPFEALNIEQQAMVVQHAYLAAGGGAAPFSSQAYAKVLTAWPQPLGARPREI